MYIYHSRVYISSIFVNEKVLTRPNENFIVPYDVYIVGSLENREIWPPKKEDDHHGYTSHLGKSSPSLKGSLVKRSWSENYWAYFFNTEMNGE